MTGRRWVVDAMNVIGSRPDRWWNDRDRAMRSFLEELISFTAATEDEVTVVFDRQPERVEPGPNSGVEVVVARRRGRDAADHEIHLLVQAHEEPGSLLVVTSDRRLAEDVRALGARVVSSGSFRQTLDRTPA